jgi:hypothetical protein
MPSPLDEQAVVIPIKSTTDGLTLRGARPGRARTFAGGVVDASDRHELLEGDAVRWRVDCTSVVDPEILPAVRLVCVYDGASPDVATLSLAMTAPSNAPLAGVFFSPAGPMRVTGTRELDNDKVREETVGFTIHSPTTDEAVAFVDVAQRRLRAFVLPTVPDDERAAMLPLMMSLARVRDARYALDTRGSRSSVGIGFGFGVGGVSIGVGGSTRGGDRRPNRDPVPLPPAHTPPPDATELESQVGSLLEAGWTEAAAALQSMVPPRLPPKPPAPPG